MAQLKNTLISGSAKVTGNIYADGDISSGSVTLGGNDYKTSAEGGEIRFDPPIGGETVNNIAIPSNLNSFIIDTVYDTWSNTAHMDALLMRFYTTGGLEIWIDGTHGVLYGAAWNDYAEFRQSKETEAGRCVQENDDGWLTRAEQRLIPGASIISDTYGFSQGETDTAHTPVAVSGRVLAYPYRDRKEYHAGMCVCSGPNGTVDIMTRDEIKEYPDCIVGIVSEVPDYEEWNNGKVKINNRIWIKVK